MGGFVKVVQSIGLLIARIGVGALLVLHGWTSWNHGTGPAALANTLNQVGMPSPHIAAWAFIIFEAVGGVFLIVGALTPLIGLLLLVEQGLLISYLSYHRGWNLLNADGSYNGGYEYSVVLGLIGLLFLVMGGGAVAVDRLFRRKKSDLEDEETPTPASANTPQPVRVP